MFGISNPFKSKTEIYVGTSVSRVIPDELLPDSVKGAMVNALFAGTDIVDNILEAATNTLENRVNRMYKYASEHSPYGMPTGDVYSNTFGGPEIAEVLEAIEGEPVLIDYRHFGSQNLLHMAWKELHENHGYNEVTNILGDLTTQKGTTVYLEDMVVEMPSSTLNSHDETETASWGIPANSGNTPLRKLTDIDKRKVLYAPTPTEFSDSVTTPRVLVKYMWGSNTAGSPIQRDQFYFYPSDPDRERGVFHVKYRINGLVKFWTYDFGTGVYPTLDSIGVDPQAVTGDFYPNIYFRLGNASIGANKASASYKSQAKMSKHLGIKFDDVLAALHENPDVGVVEQAFITFGVNADSTDQVDLKYLFEFFDTLFMAQLGGTTPEATRPLFVFGNNNGIRIADSGFEMNLINRGISKKKVPGNIGEIGFVVEAKTSISASDLVKMTGAGVVRYNFDFPCRVYKKQITKHFYEEIMVINPVMKYLVAGNQHATVLGDQDDEILLIPLDRVLAERLNSRDAERLYARSIHLVCNSLQRVKVKWYQQEWFKGFLLVVAIVLTVMSLGQDGGFFIQAAAAIATGSYVTLAVLVFWEIVQFVVVGFIAKTAVKLVGLDAAFFIAVLAAILSPMAGKDGIATSIGSITAKELLYAATALASGIGQVMEDMFQDIRNEYSSFESFRESRIKLLEEAEKELTTVSILSPYIVMGEEPSMFYKRTIHAGNIGTLVFDDIHNYVDHSLQLPNFSTTIKGFV